MAITRMGTGTTNLGPNLLTTYLNRRFVSVLRASLVAAALGMPSDMGANDGTTVRWQFFSQPAAVTTTLTEGSDPTNSADFTTTTVTGTLGEYGSYTDVSKFLLRTGLTGTKQEMVDGLAYMAAISIDTLSIGEIDGSTTSVDSGTALTAESVRQAVAALLDNNCKPHRKTPGLFPLLVTTDAAYDMMGEGAPTWFQAKSDLYQQSLQQPFQNTPASATLYGATVRTTNNVQVDTAPTPDDELGVLVADDSFGIASLDTDVMQPEIIITNPEENVGAPLRNRGTMGWWVLFVAKLFANARVVVVKADI
jgi:N4-gp56 family major capsid protein